MGSFVAIVLLGAILLVLPVVLLVLFVNMGGRLNRLQAQVAFLSERLRVLDGAYATSRQTAPAPPPPDTVRLPEAPASQPLPTVTPERIGPAVGPPDERGYREPVPSPSNPIPSGTTGIPQPVAVPAGPVRPAFNWERLFGVTLPIWLGAIALSFAGFFFVRFSVETGFFSPELRVIAGLLLGLAFLAAAEAVRRRSIANGPAIASALAAAAVATFYAVAYSASVLFGLIPANAGFIAMALVSLAAIGIALVYGQTVALVGLLGGYATPLFFDSEAPSAFILFAYLTAVMAAAFTVIRKEGWWHLTIPALLGPLAWIALWSMASELEGQHLWSSAFLLAIPLIVSIAALPAWADNRRAAGLGQRHGKHFRARLAVAWSFATAALGSLILLLQSDFALPFWQSHIILALLTAALGFVWPVSMRYLVFLPMAASALALVGQTGSSLEATAYVTGCLAAIYAFSAFNQFRRMREPALWAIALASVAVLSFALFLFQVAGWESVLENRHWWSVGALALAAAMLALLRAYGPQVPEAKRQRSIVYAAFGAATTAFISLVAVIELDPVLFPAAAALQVLGLAAIHYRRPLRGLRILASVLTAIYGLLVLGAALGMSEGDVWMRFALARSLSEAPFVLLILPGAALVGAGILFGWRDAGLERVASNPHPLVTVLELGGLAMLALGVLLIGVPDPWALGTAQSHIAAARVLAPELLLAGGALFLARRFDQPTLQLGGNVLAALAAGLGFLVLVMPLYQFWPEIELQGPPVLNTGLLSLGLPALLLLGIRWTLQRDGSERLPMLGKALAIIAVVMLFSLMLMDIRHAFHPVLLRGETWAAEYYLYSAGTMLFGIALLIVGVAARDLGARMLSLFFVVIATLKVFLFDASTLEGLWRVLSFLGMGLAFLAISWFYARYVFGLGRARPPDTPAAPAQAG